MGNFIIFWNGFRFRTTYSLIIVSFGSSIGSSELEQITSSLGGHVLYILEDI